ncbi:DNA-3-methyladenine glycosylase I [Streptomyces caniscabiei]|uniref:DNA-3-methyladenine glycosylase I n=1 Tax=Streptomyces caniscabiei TaxID=2746961 RepID=UPI0029AFF182|nr:DNA-3-methyladenine glycosylase I [Streptomyces caniscabiei]MDX2776672.1 DNA-3-methyladenine glycosylase I [Streptomyces caniscabiei]
MSQLNRCSWVAPDNELYIHYHDKEWGVPLYDDKKLFECLVLEGMQAGLSWLTILKRRENYRRAFAGFDPVKVAQFTGADIERLMQDSGVIRNRQKITAAVNNAQKFLDIQKEFGSFTAYQWSFVGGSPIQNAWIRSSQIPVTSPESITWSKDLKKRGFTFVGPTTLYAHMQACGMVNDHTVDCFRYTEV